MSMARWRLADALRIPTHQYHILCIDNFYIMDDYRSHHYGKILFYRVVQDMVTEYLQTIPFAEQNQILELLVTKSRPNPMTVFELNMISNSPLYQKFVSILSTIIVLDFTKCKKDSVIQHIVNKYALFKNINCVSTGFPGTQYSMLGCSVIEMMHYISNNPL